MNLLLKIKQIDDKKIIKGLIDKKSMKLKKYISNNAKLTWNYFCENGEYFSEVKVSGFQGPEIKAKAKSLNKFKVIDMALEKVNRQLNRRFGQKKPIRVKIDHQNFL